METARKAMLAFAAVAILVLTGTAFYTGNAAIYLLAALALFPAFLVWQRRGAND